MKLKFIAPIFVMALMFFSCGKPVLEVNPDYVGSWDNVDSDSYITITVNSDGSGSYSELDGIVTKSASGNVKIKGDEDKLKIGPKGFKIDTPPYEEGVDYDGDGMIDYYNWYMVLDGEMYEKF